MTGPASAPATDVERERIDRDALGPTAPLIPL
jgi:hypothetical protein